MNRPLVLCYHAVSPDWPAELAITPRQLEQQVGRLLDRGFRPVSLTEAVLSPSRDSFCVTFDDAYRSVRDRAVPILRRLGVTATVFVPTAHAGTGKPMSWPGIDRWIGTAWEPELVAMEWTELRALAELGWEVASHTHTHPHLTSLSDEDLRAELRRSRQICSDELGEECVAIAYPYGDHDDRVVAAAKDVGYRLATTLPVDLRSTDPLRVPRVGVYRADNTRRFQLKTSEAVLRARRSRAWRPTISAIRRAARLGGS